jgi:hypothetical protein
MRNGMSTLAKGSGDGPQCSHFWTIAAQVEDAICMCDVDIYPSSTEPSAGGVFLVTCTTPLFSISVPILLCYRRP